ncbi:MAG: hypothetical protein AB7S36_23460, partial [Planctomycetota bacterium]
SADKASEVPRPAVWAMIGKDLAASSEPTTEESGIVMQLLKLLLLAAENPATGYPQPIEASRLAGVSPEAFEHVIDWLLARSSDKAFQVRLPAMDLLGLLVGCTGAREEPFVALATEVLSGPAGSNDEKRGEWGRAAAIHALCLGQRDASKLPAHRRKLALLLVDAMDRAVASGDSNVCRYVMDSFHRALRALLDSGFRADFRSRGAGMEEMRRLAAGWRERIPAAE